MKNSKCYLLLSAFFLLLSTVFFSCRKAEIPLSAYDINSPRFFKNERKLTDNRAKIYETLKLQNEKKHFVDNLPKDIGTPIWNKLKIEKKHNFNARSADRDSSEVIYIP